MLSRFSLCDQLSVTLWAVALQAPLSVGFSRQEYQSGLPYPSPGDLLDPGIEPALLHLHWQAGSSGPTWDLCRNPDLVSNQPAP